MHDSPVVSIIIPLYNRWDYTKKCLESIVRLRAQGEWSDGLEVVTVDNGSVDETAQAIEAFRSQLNLVSLRNEQNLGFATANNQGAAVAKGRYLLLLNNDTEVLPGSLGAMIQCLEEEPQAGAIGGRLLYPNQTLQHAGMVLGENQHWFHVLRNLPKDIPWAGARTEFQVVTAAALLLTRANFLALGGFDTGYVNGYEDADLCLRLREVTRLRVIYEPAAVFIHHESMSEGRYAKESQNRRRFLDRWQGKVVVDAGTYYHDLMARMEKEASALSQQSVDRALRNAYRQFIFAELHHMHLDRLLSEALASRDFRLGHALLRPLRYLKRQLAR